MYFLYIYKTMKGFKRITIMPYSNKPKSIKEILSYSEGVNKTISFVDHLTEIKNACDRVVLKNRKIKKYLNEGNEVFSQDFITQMSDRQGTTFLISKN